MGVLHVQVNGRSMRTPVGGTRREAKQEEGLGSLGETRRVAWRRQVCGHRTATRRPPRWPGQRTGSHHMAAESRRKETDVIPGRFVRKASG